MIPNHDKRLQLNDGWKMTLHPVVKAFTDFIVNENQHGLPYWAKDREKDGSFKRMNLILRNDHAIMNGIKLKIDGFTIWRERECKELMEALGIPRELLCKDLDILLEERCQPIATMKFALTVSPDDQWCKDNNVGTPIQYES